MTELVGKTLGGYKLVERIGSGALATVYKAHQTNLKRWVAVKVLHYKESQALARFQREAHAIARLRHRNIVIVYEYGEEESWPYIVMEYIEGGTLESLLNGEPMDWVKALTLIIPVAEALEYAHGQGLIHRDIKPSNILVPQDGWPLLADFGLVKMTDTNEALTGPGIAIGTPAYVAPEQARGLEVDHRSDMYALGVLLFEMVTGRLPFDYQNPNRILLAHISEPVPSARQFNPDCPRSLEKVITRSMQKSPDDRYPDMQEMVLVLKDVLTSSDERPAFYKSSPPPLESFETVVKSPAVDPELTEGAERPTRPTRKASASSLEARIFLVDQKVSIPVPDRDNVTVGRTHQNIVADLDLGPHGAVDAGVSRHHARLIKKDGGWLIDDLDSLNGTYVNNVKVNPGQPTPLNDGDLVRCSHLSFIFLTSTGS